MDTRYIIFSDLDGTLLDYSTYSFEEAIPALNLIRKNKIPLILVSSKTREELIAFQKKLNLRRYPFVVENGSAVFTPPGFFPDMDGETDVGGYDCYCLGKTYPEICLILDELSEKYDYQIKGFHNASQKEIYRETLLHPYYLKRAMNREYSVPVFFDRRAEEILTKEAPLRGLRLLYGGRFMHLLGDLDKGTATRLIISGYRSMPEFKPFKTIALGDSLNDFAMLAAVDYPVLVRRHDGTYEARESIDNMIFSPFMGPRGWKEALLKLLNNGGQNE